MVRWLVEPGATVKPAQPLLEVLTDKATMEIPSPFSGTIEKLSANTGDMLKIGQVLLTYSPLGQSASASSSANSTPIAEEAVNGSPQPHAAVHVAGPTPLAVKASPSIRQM